MKPYFLLIALFTSVLGFSQNDTYYETYPKFEDCDAQTGESLKQCFIIASDVSLA